MRISVLSVGFDNITKDEAVSKAMSLMTKGDRKGPCPYVVTPNPEMIMSCQQDGGFAKALSEAALSLADGVGVIYGARLLGRPLKEKIPGIDFASALIASMAEKGMSVFLYGSKPGVAEAAGERLAKEYPGLVIAGSHHGYDKDDEAVLELINAAKPDFLFVCLGFPRQEMWLQKNRDRLNAGLAAALGGSLDVLSGQVERAPAGFQRLGLEWLYRLLKEPSRIGRMKVLPVYLMKVIGSRGRHD